MRKRQNKSNQPIQTIKQQWVSCFIMLYASFGIAIAIDFILNIPLGLIIGYTNSLFSDVLYFLCSVVCVYVLSYRDGRKNYQFKLWRLLLALALTIAVQVLLAILIGGNTVYWSGPAIVFAHSLLDVYNPVEIPSRTVLDTYQWLLMLAADLFVYVPTIIVGKYLGNKKRIKEFNESKESEPANEVG